MEYRVLGTTGAKVSRLCLGAWMFGDPTDEAESHRILDAAREAGVNFVDTANVYARGRSEEIIGRWFAQGGGRREETFLATKVHRAVAPGPNGGGNHRHTVLLRVDESLRRLQTDHIDLYYFHRPDPDTPIAEQVGVMQDLVRAGKVRYYGTSHYPSWMILQGMWDAEKRGGPPWVADQPRYSLLDRAIEQDIVPFCRATGYALVPHSPLAGGLLTGKYRRGAPPPEGSRATRSAGLLDGLTDAHWALLERLETIAGQAGCTPSQAAIAWVLTRPFVTASIIGPRTLAQCHDNLGALSVRLPPEAVRALDDASAFATGIPARGPAPAAPATWPPV
jgi:aryl-alcohol dehydrogenase-like predicted oxidoreductase